MEFYTELKTYLANTLATGIYFISLKSLSKSSLLTF